MRFAFAVLALAASASASLVARQTIPSCANTCLFGTKVDLDGCKPTDNVCLCNSQPFVSTSTACIESACSGDDLATALSVARQLCASVGVTLTSDVPVSTHPPAPASSSSPSASAPSTTAASAPSTTSNAAAPHRGPVTALAGLAAVGLAALAL